MLPPASKNSDAKYSLGVSSISLTNLGGGAGSAQTTKNGDLFVSWGGLSYFSEFSPSGKLLFNAKLPDGVGTYRAYRLPWNPG
ncbi:MAG TPA: hypothetical protein VF482_06485 [Trebonia sp.]